MERNKRRMNLLGIARKAGRLEFGSDAVKEAALQHRAKLILLSAGLSQRTVKNMQKAAEEAGVPVAALPERMDEIGAALGKRAGVIAVDDMGFAKALLKLSAENEEE